MRPGYCRCLAARICFVSVMWCLSGSAPFIRDYSIIHGCLSVARSYFEMAKEVVCAAVRMFCFASIGNAKWRKLFSECVSYSGRVTHVSAV